MLNLPEGTVRGMLSKLSEEGLIDAKKLGCILTEQGKEMLSGWLKRHNIISIQPVDFGPLKIADAHVAVQVRKVGQIPLLEKRDLAVRAGAKGAIMLTFSKGKLGMPLTYPDLPEAFPKVATALSTSFHFEDGDLLIIGGAENEWRALEGALAIAASLTL